MNLYVHCSVIYNSQDIETTLVDKEDVIDIDIYKYYSANKKEKFFHLQQHGWTLEVLC